MFHPVVLVLVLVLAWYSVNWIPSNEGGALSTGSTLLITQPDDLCYCSLGICVGHPRWQRNIVQQCVRSGLDRPCLIIGSPNWWPGCQYKRRTASAVVLRLCSVQYWIRHWDKHQTCWVRDVFVRIPNHARLGPMKPWDQTDGGDLLLLSFWGLLIWRHC